MPAIATKFNGTHHERVVIRCPDRDTLQAVDDQVHEPSDRLLLALAALFKLGDKLGRDLDRRAKLDDGARAELVRVEVRHADGDDLQFQVGVGRDGAEGHDRDAGFERQQVGAVVRAAFGEDTDRASLGQALVDGRVHVGLVDVRQDLLCIHSSQVSSRTI